MLASSTLKIPCPMLAWRIYRRQIVTYNPIEMEWCSDKWGFVSSFWQKELFAGRALFFIIYLFILFIYFWLWWVFIAARRFSLVVVNGDYSLLRCVDFSLWWLLLLQSMGSRHVGFRSCGSRALEHRLSSCGARASLLCGMWVFPWPGLKPIFPTLAGGLSTTAPPRALCRRPLLSCHFNKAIL